MKNRRPGRPHPEELRQRAIKLRQDGASHTLVANILGVSQATVRRWTDPEYAEQQRQTSRAYKERKRKTCPGCGKSIWHTSKTCPDCNDHNLRWTREAIIEAIQQWAEKHGRPPVATDWVIAGKDHPAVGTVHSRVFNSWADAVEAAGFPRPTMGNKVRRHDEERAQILELHKQGKTLAQISKIMRMPPSYTKRLLHGRDALGKPPLAAPKKRTREQRIADLRKALAKQDDA